MEVSTFSALFPQIVERLCVDIRHVYHLDSTDALNTLHKTHFYVCLSKEQTGLWKLDSNALFTLYQDEIEYGKLITGTSNGV